MFGRFGRPLVFLGFLLFVGVLSLADRAPDQVKTLLGAGRRLGSEAEHRLGADWLDRADIPFAFDTIGHVVLWAGVGFLAWTAFGRRTSTWFMVVALIALSAGVEVGQHVLSSTRHPEMSDAIANALGVGLGTVAAISFWTVIGSIGKMTRNLSG